MSAEQLVQQLVNALSLGSLYALLALGLAMVYSVLGLLNFAYGELVTVTGYTILLGLDAGLPLPAAALMGVAAAVVAALVIEALAFRPLRGAPPITLLFSSFAVAVIVQNLIRQLVSPRPQGIAVPPWIDDVWVLGGLRVSVLAVVTLVVSLAALAALAAFLQRSRVGLAMRAAAQNFEVARLMGARANRVIALSFAVSGLIAGVAGLLWVARSGSVTPAMGFAPILKAFIATVIGGLGDLRGAVVGGFALGFIEIALIVALPASARPFTDASALLVVVAVLAVRPQGLAGRRSAVTA